MRTYKISNEYHNVYDYRDEVPEHIIIHPDWRQADVGDWVEADDGCVVQVLRRGKMSTPRGRVKTRYYIGTCTGTFMQAGKRPLDTTPRENRWTLSGKDTETVILTRKQSTKRETLFCAFMAQGFAPEDAYLQAYTTKNRKYAREQSATLMKTERIRKTMKEELKPVCERLKISDESVLEEIKRVADTSQKDETKLKALFKLADILDLEDKNSTKVTTIQGAVFKGFGENALENIERPQLIGKTEPVELHDDTKDALNDK